MTERIQKRLATLGSALAVAVVLSPVVDHLRANPADGFPLSYYPMFSSDRGQHLTVTYLQGIDREGQARPLTYRLAGSGGLNQVRKQIRRMVSDERADELCRRVAAQAAKRTGARFRSLRAIHVVSGTYDFRDYFRDRTAPVTEVRHAACEIEEKKP